MHMHHSSSPDEYLSGEGPVIIYDIYLLIPSNSMDIHAVILELNQV
jgi:hypothetical protein